MLPLGYSHNRTTEENSVDVFRGSILFWGKTYIRILLPQNVPTKTDCVQTALVGACVSLRRAAAAAAAAADVAAALQESFAPA